MFCSFTRYCFRLLIADATANACKLRVRQLSWRPNYHTAAAIQFSAGTQQIQTTVAVLSSLQSASLCIFLERNLWSNLVEEKKMKWWFMV